MNSNTAATVRGGRADLVWEELDVGNPDTNTLRKVARQTLSDAIYDALRQAIVSGELADGLQLNQVALAEKFGVSRVPVREALQRLTAEGLVSGDSFHKVVVTAIDAAELVEYFEIREELEVLALKRQLTEGAPIDLAAARELNDRFGSTRDGDRRLALDREFHMMFAEASPRTAKAVDDIRTRTQKYIGRVIGGSARRKIAHAEHVAILDAIEADDLDRAMTAMRVHISATRRMLTDYVSRRS